MTSFEMNWHSLKQVFYIILGCTIVMAVCTVVNLFINGLVMDETNSVLIVIDGLEIVASVYFYRLAFVSKYVVYDDKIVRTPLIGRETTYLYRDIDIQHNDLIIEALNSEGMTIFRLNVMLSNTDRFIKTFMRYKLNHPESVKIGPSNEITPNFYFRNFGFAYAIIGSVLIVCSLLMKLNEPDLWILLFIMLLVGTTFFVLGVIWIMIYLRFKIIVEEGFLRIGKKQYPLHELTLAFTTHTISIFHLSKRMIRFNIHFYYNHEILYSKIGLITNQ